jgi:predicted metal-dependent peptidase
MSNPHAGVAPPPPKPLTQAEIDKETQRIKRARTLCLIKHPFFGYLSAKLKLVATDNIPSMATDGRSLFFNPRFTALLDDDQTLTGLVHEVMHCASEHFDRQGTRDAERWKKACDHAINPIILKSGFKAISIPGVFEWLCDPAQYGGKTAEVIYDALPPEPPDGGGKCGCVIIRGEMKKPGDGTSSPDPNAPQTGTGVVDASAPPPPPPPVNWKRAVVEAATFARMRGKLPGHLEDLVEEIVHPKTDWKRVIRSAFSVAQKTDWSWRRPNKRYAHQGIILPTPYGYTTSVRWYGDTSGSVGAKFFALGLGGAVEICRQLRIQIDCGVFDAAIQGFWENVKDSNILKTVQFLGRGGTDFRPIFQHLKETKKRKPDCVVIVTDLYGTFPEKSEKPPCQVIWMAPDTSKGVEVPFGQRLFVNLKELGV